MTKITPLERVLQILKESGFYWNDIDRNEAKDLLQHRQPGTFLVRPSSDSRHMFTLTLKTMNSVRSIRIVMLNGQFWFETSGDCFAPSFDCVVKLVDFYVKEGSKAITEGNTERTAKRKLLTQPLYKEASGLKHLCRVAVNRHLRPDGCRTLPLPATLKLYLRQYPYSV